MSTNATAPDRQDPNTNPCGMRGLEFVEFSSNTRDALVPLFDQFGFSHTMTAPAEAIELYEQNAIRFVLNTEPNTHGARFFDMHGPGISSLGFRVDNAEEAHRIAVSRGAVSYDHDDKTLDAPAILGIGSSLIYFIDKWGENGDFFASSMVPSWDAPKPDKGFLLIDHLTNNVHKGTLGQWADFYKNVFGFTEVRHFDIKGEKTGLYSFALRSPDGSFCIPINEGTDKKSQIEEYLREYHGPGIQHLAFLSRDLLASLDAMKSGEQAADVEFLDIDDAYYESVFDRVPGVQEEPTRIQSHQVLVDGDEEGYLLQIFTKNVVGPIFIELIQRKNHLSFGEGNFGALFRSIERDQERRGVI